MHELGRIDREHEPVILGKTPDHRTHLLKFVSGERWDHFVCPRFLECEPAPNHPFDDADRWARQPLELIHPIANEGPIDRTLELLPCSLVDLLEFFDRFAELT